MARSALGKGAVNYGREYPGDSLIRRIPIRFRTALVRATLLVAVSAAWAQEPHPPTPTPPPAAKKIKCSGRPVPQLEDITEKAGIRFRHTSNPLNTYIVESMSGGVILFDYDRDGWLDIYFTNAPTVQMALRKETSRGALYHNNRDGTFTDVTDKSGLATPCFAMGGAVADYNNDWWPDLYLTRLGGNVLFRNNGDGTFTDVAEKAGVADGRMSTGAAFGDYDRDGFVDLMVVNYVEFQLDHLPPFGGLSLCRYRGIDVYCGPRGLKGAGDSLFRNNGDGTFTDVSKAAGVGDPHGYYGLGVVWADFNNTGWPDIYVANDTLPNFLYRNDGKGRFTEIGLESGTALSETGSEQASMGIAIGDYIHNGRPSIYVTNFADDYSDLYRNDGNWMFSDVSYQSGVALPSFPFVKWGDAFADLDNDGWLDLVAVNGHVYPEMEKAQGSGGYWQPQTLLFNQKDGTFCDASSQAGAALEQKRASRGLAVGGLFNDCNVDIVVEDLDSSPMILRNHCVAGRHWTSFELAGTKSNRMAIGARVKVVAGGMTQTDEVRSGGSYLSQSDVRLHFGLGAAEKIDMIEIHWPSGKVETIKDLAVDRFYAILEGEGIVPPERIYPSAPVSGK